MESRAIRYLPLLFIVALLPTMIFRDFTPSNELRYLSIADEAIDSGNIFTFTNQGEPYADKPPLYIWLVMLGRVVMGRHLMWLLALFSVVPALVIVRTMNRWVEREMSTAERGSASVMMLSCGLFLALALVLRMDMLMNMFITLALYTFYRMYCGRIDARRNAPLFGFWLFMALFSKGPVGVLVPLVSTLAFLVCKGQWRTIPRYWGWRTWAVVAGGCVVWWSGVFVEGGADYLHNLLFHQTIDRAVDAFHHKEPFYFYLISFWYSMAPWSLFAVVAIAVGVGRGLLRSDLEKLFLTIAVSTFVMLSAFSSKIAIYLSPIFPFVLYLGVLMSMRLGRRSYLTACIVLPAVVWIVTLPALVVAAQRAELAWLDNGWLYGAGALLTLTGVGAIILLFRFRNTLQPAIRALSLGVLGALFVGGFALPKINAVLGYGELCRRAVEVAGQRGSERFFVWRIRRPEGMDVYLGRDVERCSPTQILEGRCDGGVVMLPMDRLRKEPDLLEFVRDRERDSVGGYLIVVP